MAQNDNFVIEVLTEKYLVETAHLLNEQWPNYNLRTRLAMLRYNLQKEQHHNLPVSFVLIHNQRVIGHVMLSVMILLPIVENRQQKIIMLESLLVSESFRNRGLGKRLVHFCEEYLSTKKINGDLLDAENLYLTTTDKQTFYESLGFERTSPFAFRNVRHHDVRAKMLLHSIVSTLSFNKLSTFGANEGAFFMLNNSTFYKKSLARKQ